MENAFTLFWSKCKRLNWALLASTFLLATLGILFVRSACSARETAELRNLWVGQLQFALYGAAIMAVLAFWDYRHWLRWAPWIYFGVLVSLVLVLIPGFGVARMGARRWLYGLQPSEPAKLGVIFLLAWLLGAGEAWTKRFRGLAACVAIVGVPAALILCEPDLGTVLVLGPTALAMLFAARVTPKTLGAAVLAAALAVAYEVTLIHAATAPETDPARAERLMKLTLLKPYQVKRVETFLYPQRDLTGKGWNAYQSEIAVGSGGAWGKGYGKGVQHRLGFLPAKVSVNDFIFPVVAEETGFAGSAALLGLFFFGCLVPGVIIGSRCDDDEGRLLCAGTTALLFCHVFINIGMTVRIVPITGLPLPFISQGGTFMLVAMSAAGVLQSVAIHGRMRRDSTFRR